MLKEIFAFLVFTSSFFIYFFLIKGEKKKPHTRTLTPPAFQNGIYGPNAISPCIQGGGTHGSAASPPSSCPPFPADGKVTAKEEKEKKKKGLAPGAGASPFPGHAEGAGAVKVSVSHGKELLYFDGLG